MKRKQKERSVMQNKNALFPEAVVRQVWLNYFNDYLRERKIITEEEWRKMRRLIEAKYNMKTA